MSDDNSFKKIIDAKNAFRVKKINDIRASKGLPPITEKDLRSHDNLNAYMEAKNAEKNASVVDDIIPEPISLGKNNPELAAENAKRLKEAEGTYLDPYSMRLKTGKTAIGDIAENQKAQVKIKNLDKKINSLNFDDLNRQVYQDQIDDILEGLNAKSLDKAIPKPESKISFLNAAKRLKQDIEFNKKMLPYDQEKAIDKLSYLKRRNPSGMVSAEYNDFRTPLEKIIDSTKILNPNKLKQLAVEAPEKASKFLGKLAPGLAGLDLAHKLYETGSDPTGTAEEIRKKGLVQDLTEIGVDAATLGVPISKLLGYPGVAAGLEGVSLPLGGYLAGRQVSDLMGGEHPDYENTPKSYTGDPLVYTPGESEESVLSQNAASQMPNYSEIKKLLEKKKI